MHVIGRIGAPSPGHRSNRLRNSLPNFYFNLFFPATSPQPTTICRHLGDGVWLVAHARRRSRCPLPAPPWLGGAVAARCVRAFRRRLGHSFDTDASDDGHSSRRTLYIILAQGCGHTRYPKGIGVTAPLL